MTHEEIAEKGWNARFPKTPWVSVTGYPRERQLQKVASVVRTETASDEMESYYLRAMRGELSAPAPVEKPQKPPAKPVAVVVEPPPAKRPTLKKEK